VLAATVGRNLYSKLCLVGEEAPSVRAFGQSMTVMKYLEVKDFIGLPEGELQLLFTGIEAFLRRFLGRSVFPGPGICVVFVVIFLPL